MKKDLAVLILIVVAILAFIMGYSLSPTPAVKQAGSQPAATAPGYGDEGKTGNAVAPGYDDAKPRKTTAPGYDE